MHVEDVIDSRYEIERAERARGLALWIEVGNQSARRLYKAAKAAARVVVLTYKNPAPLLEEIRAEGVHKTKALSP